MSTDLFIPLAELSGLDPVGLRVTVRTPGKRSRVALMGEEYSPPTVCRLHERGGCETLWLDLDKSECSTLHLDLADAATRDRCLRWLANRVGVKPIGSGSPRWARWEDTAAWELENEVTWAATGDSEDGGGWRGVPALAGINYTDTTRLPDGSKLIDAVALSLVLCSVRTP